MRMPANGTERQLAGVLRAAHGQRWDATLCVLHAGDALTRELAAAGVPTVELDGAGGALGRAWALRRLVAGGRFDVVHSSLWGGNVAARLAAASRHRPATVIAERRVEDFRPRSRRLVDLALRPLTDTYIGNSEEVAGFICRAHGVEPGRVSVIRNGIDTDVFHTGGRPATATGVRRLGAMGRLVHQKGFDVLLAALPLVLERRAVELVIAGGGEDEASLRGAAAGLPVRFLGVLSTPNAVADFLRGLDVFVMPSRYEGLPNAVLEAMACGIPVVATTAPGMAEATAGQARLVPCDDRRALASAIADALEDDGWRPAASPAASFEEVADRHLEVFERAVARQPARGGPVRRTR
jgi:glycosyltransferase involved in cell wall biosynthesis